MNRKRFLTTSFFGLTSFSFFGFSKTKNIPKCITQSDDLGPFFRENTPMNNDMAVDQKGMLLTISGVVYGGISCDDPISNAMIDIWHAGSNGKYDNTSKNYSFRSKLRTNSYGEYSFNTILPGYYRNRPRHIHYKIESKGYRTLVTQLYFKSDDTKSDFLSEQANEERIIELEQNDKGLKGAFNIYLQKTQTL